MTPIDVALCITELDLGGAERCLTELALRVDRQKFRPVVYCLGPRPKKREASCLQRLEAAGVEVHVLGGRTIWQFPLIAGRLRRLFAAQRPRIVQTFLFHANIVGRIAARRAGLKAVVSGIRVAEHGSSWHLWLDRLTQGWVDRYVCVSRSVAEYSIKKGGIPAEKVVVIPTVIDLDVYPAAKPADPASLGVPAGRQLVTSIGRLTPQKGVDWLLESATRWMPQLPEADLLLVGEGPMRKKLEAMCRDGGIAGRVHFAGWRADVAEILAASRLLVLPSRWEGMPNVVLEAMASGLPVAATKVEGVCELLGDGSARQTVALGDSQALAEKIVRLMQHPGEAAQIGQDNRRRVEAYFSIDRAVAAYENLWTALVSGRA